MSTVADKVFSFEPWSVARDRLHEKLTINGVENVAVFAVALGDTDSDLCYGEPVLSDGNIGWRHFIQALEDGTPTTILPKRRADRLFKESGISPVSLIKIDVEGFGGQVIMGLEDTLQSDRPPMSVEFSESAISCFDALVRRMRLERLSTPNTPSTESETEERRAL